MLTYVTLLEGSKDLDEEELVQKSKELEMKEKQDTLVHIQRIENIVNDLVGYYSKELKRNGLRDMDKIRNKGVYNFVRRNVEEKQQSQVLLNLGLNKNDFDVYGDDLKSNIKYLQELEKDARGIVKQLGLTLYTNEFGMIEKELREQRLLKLLKTHMRGLELSLGALLQLSNIHNHDLLNEDTLLELELSLYEDVVDVDAVGVK